MAATEKKQVVSFLLQKKFVSFEFVFFKMYNEKMKVVIKFLLIFIFTLIFAGRKSKCEIVGDDEKNNDFFRLIKGIQSNEVEVQIAAVSAIRKFISDETDFVKENIEKSGLISSILKCLKSSNPKLQYETTVTLSDLISVIPELSNAIIKESDAIPQLIKLINNKLTFQIAIKVLATLISKNPEDLRQLYLKHEIIIPILSSFSPYDSSTFNEDVFLIIDNLYDPEKDDFRLFISIWANLIHEFDASTVLQTIETIGHLSSTNDKNDETEKYIVDKRVIKHLVQLMNGGEPYIFSSLAICLFHISKGSAEQIQHIFDSGFLQNFDKMFYHSDETVHLCGIILLSNLITKDEKQLEAVFNSKYIPLIMEYFKSENSEKRQVATKFFTKAVIYGKSEHILYFLKLNLVCYLSNHLKEHQKDSDNSEFHTTWIKSVFKCFQNIFDKIPKSETKGVSLEIIKCGGNDVITKFVKQKVSEISEVAVKIIYEMGRAMNVLDSNDSLREDL